MPQGARIERVGEEFREILAEAIQELKGLLNGTQSDRETLLVISQIYSQARRFPEAEEAVQKSMSLSPQPDDQVRAHFILGSIYEREKKYDLAEEEFKKVLAFDPLNGAAANYLGYMLADRGVRLDESVNYIQKALQTDPNNGAYLDSLGWVLFMLICFYLVTEVLEYRKWTFPLVVVGANSIFIYSLGFFIGRPLDRAVSVFTFRYTWIGTLAPVAQSCTCLAVMWYLCYWLYKRNILIKI